MTVMVFFFHIWHAGGCTITLHVYRSLFIYIGLFACIQVFSQVYRFVFSCLQVSFHVCGSLSCM